MKKHLLLIIICALLVGDLTISFWNNMRTPQIAYVRSQELVYGYFGMKDAMTRFQNEQGAWKANVDTLKADLERGITELRSGDLDAAALRAKQVLLQKQQNDLMNYQQAMEGKMHEEEQKLLAEVLGQVNSFIERYAEERGYDVVLGTTNSGSLLYGQGGMDITEELLAALNKDHQGQ